MQHSAGIPPEDIERHLLEVLSSPEFSTATRLSGFLKFIVKKTLAGQGGEITDLVVATEVYGRNPSDYDPKVDAIIRVEASRLRNRLRTYYETDGKDSGMCIELPKGAYVPEFHRKTIVPPGHKPLFRKTLTVSVCILVTVGLIAFAYVRYIGKQAESAIGQGRKLLGGENGLLLRDIDHPSARSLKDVVLAIQAFRRAVSLEPQSASAHTHLAWAYFTASEQDSQYGSLAKDEIREATTLDPNSAEAHAVAAYIAFYWEWDFASALRQISRALDLDPQSESLYRLYNDSASVLGRFKEAAERLQEGRSRLPNSHAIAEEQAELLYRTGQYPGLIAKADALQNPRLRALALEREDKLAEADQELRKALQSAPDEPRVKAALGQVLAREGNRAAALEIAAFFRPHSPTSVALIYAGLGDADEACAWLEKARTAHDRNLPLVAVDPRFRSLAADVRFRKVLSQLGLTFQAR